MRSAAGQELRMNLVRPIILSIAFVIAFGSVPATAQTATGSISGRDILIAPALVNFDCALVKNIAITEKLRLLMRGEAFNLLNRAQFGLPNRTVDLPQAGIISGTFAPPRQIQLALRLQF
jgi:hypothetical protein